MQRTRTWLLREIDIKRGGGVAKILGGGMRKAAIVVNRERVYAGFNLDKTDFAAIIRKPDLTAGRSWFSWFEEKCV